MKKIIIVATHPIQYQVPWFRALSKSDEFDLTVLFGIIPDAKSQGVGFNKEFTWDIPLTNGFEWILIQNASKTPGLDNFRGINCPEIKELFAKLKPEAVLLTGWHSMMLLQAAYYARQKNIFLIMRGDSNALHSRPVYKKIIHHFLLSKINAFISTGSSNKQFYLNNGVRPSRIFDTLHFVENDRFLTSSKLSNQEKLQLREDLNIHHDSFCFVYSGKLITKKNVQELLVAFNTLYKNHNNIHLLIIGDGEKRCELEGFVEANDLSVTFSGFVNQSEIPAMYSIGNCFVLCSDFGETWGLVVNEAMLCGLPAIVSDRVGCGPDLIISGETGFTYQFGNIDQLTTKMEYMLLNPKRTLAMGIKAREHVTLNSNIDKTVSVTAEIIKMFDLK